MNGRSTHSGADDLPGERLRKPRDPTTFPLPHEGP